MSSRVLRKLQEEKEIEKSHFSDEDGEGFEFIPSKPRRKKKEAVNPFDLLNVNQSSEEEANDEGKDAMEDEEEKAWNEPKQKRNDTKKKKKKKQKKKDAQKQAPDMEEENIDKTIQEVNMMLGINSNTMGGPATSAETTTFSMDTRALFGVEHRNLNAESEMKKRFGAQIMRAENRQRRGHNRIYHRSSWFVNPKQSWPHMGKTGITMKLLESKNGCSYFLFEHSQSYQNTQFQFLDAVESMDPNNISAILNIHPYHIDSLLQLSEISKMGEDYQMAAELIERALYCFECSFHTLFSLTQGTCRLDYRRTENRPFFIALFQHLVFVGKRGCYRTALEFCKLIMSLEPDEDPLGVLLMIDFYALMSEEFAFLIRLYNEWEPHRNLSQLPNFAFSVALAYFHSGEQGNSEKADQMLQKALIMFPSVLPLLLDKCNVMLNSSLVSHSFFSPLVTGNTGSDPVALQQLVTLYVGRSYHCWKRPEVIDWLTTNLKAVLERVDARDPLVDECRQKRQVRYRGTPRNIHRHIILSDIKDVAASLPMEFTNMPLMSYDPLPPKDSVSAYTRPRSHSSQAQEHGMFSMFLRSLNPSFNAQEPDAAGVHVEARPEMIVGEGAEGGARPLRDTEIARGVESLMAAMRDLLNTLSYRGPHEQPGNEDEDNREEGWGENEDPH